jgi:hypothetical protein
MYEQKKYLYEWLATLVKSMADLPQSVQLLQENFIFDYDKQYPIFIESDFDVKTWEQKKTIYSVETHEKFFKLRDYSEQDFFRLRRQGIHKNRFLEIN